MQERVVVKAGEKNRLVSVTFATPDEGNPSGSSGSTAPEPSSSSSPPIAAYVLGGVGLAALGAALYLDLAASGDAHDLRSSCSPNCAQSDVDDVKSKYTIAGVTAGIGGALLVTGVVLFFVHGKSSSKTGANPLRPSLTPTSLATGALLRF